MVCLKVILVLFQSLMVVSSGRIQDKLFGKKQIHLTRLDGQCGGKNVPIVLYMNGYTVNSEEGHCRNVTIVIKENNISTPAQKCSLTVTRCQSRENLDSCEEFIKQQNISFCQMINPDNIIAGRSPLAIPYKPKLKCPCKKGVYQASNVTLNLKPILIIPVDGWYWKIKIECRLTDVNRLISCGYIEGYVVAGSRN